MKKTYDKRPPAICESCKKACNQNKCEFVRFVDEEHIPQGAEYEVYCRKETSVVNYYIISCPNFEEGRDGGIINEDSAISLCETLFEKVAEDYFTALAYGNYGNIVSARRAYERFWGWDFIGEEKDMAIKNGKFEIETKAKLFKEANETAGAVARLIIDIVPKADIKQLKEAKGFLEKKAKALCDRGYIDVLGEEAETNNTAKVIKELLDREYKVHNERRRYYMDVFLGNVQKLINNRIHILESEKQEESNG